jgi:hypothetical protein
MEEEIFWVGMGSEQGHSLLFSGLVRFRKTMCGFSGDDKCIGKTN